MTTKTAQQLDAEGRCLACKEVHKKRKRGLCEPDYGRFRRRKDALPKDRREAFDEMCVSKGLILSDGRNVEDPFAAALEEFLLTTGTKEDQVVGRTTAEGIDALGLPDPESPKKAPEKDPKPPAKRKRKR